MKIAIFALALLFPVLLQASVIKVVSPTTAQTYSYSDVTWRSLRWSDSRQELTANITFSTYNYVTQFEPLREESYDFSLPGVKFDKKTNLFFVTTAKGKRVDVAELSRDLIGKSIKPLPGTVIYVIKQSGKVVVALTATSAPVTPDFFQTHWVEDNQGFYLQNLVKLGVEKITQ
jgi:hypothetical protein